MADQVPPDAITDLSFASGSHNSVAVEWTAPGGSGSEGRAMGYEIRYSQSSITEANFSSAIQVTDPPTPASSGELQSFTLEGLLPESTYYIALKSYDLFDNFSSLSNVTSGTTLRAPIISVTPAAFSSDLLTGEVSVVQLHIGNEGGSELDYRIRQNFVSEPFIQGSYSPSSLATASEQRAEEIYADQPEPGQAAISSAGGFGVSPSSAGALFGIDHNAGSIVQLNPGNGIVLNEIPLPEAPSGGPDGLAYDGTWLYYVNGFGTKDIYKLNPSNGEVLSVLSIAGLPNIDGLGHSGDYLYALDFSSNTILEIDFARGEVLREILPGYQLAGGLSFGGERGSLFVSNFGAAIYEIDLETLEGVKIIDPSGSTFGLAYSKGLNVILVANVYSNTIEGYDPDTGSLQFSYETPSFSAIAGDEYIHGNWLGIGQNTGIIAAGGSQSIDVTLDAFRLEEGTHEREIIISHNAQDQDDVLIPVQLFVTGAPDAVIADETLDFGSQFTNYPVDLELNIENAGVKDLEVTNIAIDNAVYSIATASLSIPGGESSSIVMTFEPIEAGTFDASLSFDLNDPSTAGMTVPVTGSAVHPPVIDVSPQIFDEQLFSGETITNQFFISNTGNSDLTYSISNLLSQVPSTISYIPQGEMEDRQEEPNGPGQTQNFVLQTQQSSQNSLAKVLYFSDTGDGVRVGDAALANLNVNVFGYLNNYQAFVNDLQSEAWDLVVFESTSYNYDFTAISQYVANGGRLIISYWSNDEFIAQFMGATKGASLTSPQPLYMWQDHPSNTFPNDIGTLWTGGDNYFDNGDKFLPGEGSVAVGGFTSSYEDYEAGMILGNEGRTWLNGFLFSDYRGIDDDADGKQDIIELIENQVTYLLDASWLSTSPGSGVVPQGSSVAVDLLFDGTYLNDGVYSKELLLTSNDPSNKEITLEANLIVDGEPDINLPVVDIDFGNVGQGTVMKMTLVISNEGSAQLTADISTGTAEFQTGASSIILSPDQDVEIDVIFSPNELGTFDDIISISTNDPDEPELQVSLTGTGVSPPSIAIDIVEISDALTSGASSAQSFNISNNGEISLQFDIAVDGPVSASTSQASEEMYLEPTVSPEQASSSGSSDEDEPASVKYPRAVGDFVQLMDSPVPVSAVSADSTGHIYALEYQGSRFYRYDPVDNIWEQLTSIPVSTGHGGGAVYLNGKIYASSVSSATLASYDISEDSWTTHDIPYATNNISTDGNILYMGYYWSLGSFDPVTDRWTNLTGPPLTLYSNGGLSFYEGHLYAHGGNGTRGFARYSLSADEWEMLPTLPDGAVLGSAIDPIDKVFYAYGNYGADNMYAYHIEDNEWRLTKIPYFVVYDGGIASIVKNGFGGIYFVEGRYGTGVARLETRSEYDWLTLSSYKGEVLPGQSREITASLDAWDLVGGVYDVDLKVLSNDPANSSVVLPVHLEVTGTPRIHVSQASLDFGDQYIDFETDLELVIENPGTDELTVSSLNFSDDQFSTEITSVQIQARSEQVIPLTFSPKLEGVISAELQIGSNDPDTPELILSLNGNGLPPPLSVLPTTLHQELAYGEKSTQTLTILNESDTDNLDFSLSTDFLTLDDPEPLNTGV